MILTHKTRNIATTAVANFVHCMDANMRMFYFFCSDERRRRKGVVG